MGAWSKEEQPYERQLPACPVSCCGLPAGAACIARASPALKCCRKFNIQDLKTKCGGVMIPPPTNGTYSYVLTGKPLVPCQHAAGL